MNRIPFLDLKAQYRTIRAEVLPALEAVCESTGFAQGPATRKFEEEFAAYCGVKHCVTLNSGTSALHVAMLCLGIGPGDEVILPAMTFIATAWGVSYVGAKPVFVDVDPARRTIDPNKLEAAITPRTKAIIPVHLYGMPADMDAIMAVAGKHGIPVVEDAAQSQGAKYRSSQQSTVSGQRSPVSSLRSPVSSLQSPVSSLQSPVSSLQSPVSSLRSPVSSLQSPVWRRCGSMGVISCTSFYPGKNLGAYGEGGALLTNSDEYAAHARRLRDHGQSQRYHHDEVGYNYRMDSFQAAVLSIKLRHLDNWNSQRAAHARRYSELLAETLVTRPSTFDDSEPVWHLYVIECDNRDKVRERLSAAGVDTGLHYPIPLHLQKAYAGLGHGRGSFPVSERIAERCISLPMFPELTDEQLNAVATALRDATKKIN